MPAQNCCEMGGLKMRAGEKYQKINETLKKKELEKQSPEAKFRLRGNERKNKRLMKRLKRNVN